MSLLKVPDLDLMEEAQRMTQDAAVLLARAEQIVEATMGPFRPITDARSSAAKANRALREIQGQETSDA